jgi:2-polyprenyl-3-methyl-5-hydroxy-6-metoxy-1,4-benzoquinol methylase
MKNADLTLLTAIATIMPIYAPAVAEQQAPQATAPSAANAHMHQMDFAALVKRFESPERAAWQKPDAVIAIFGNIAGKTIADIGAGTGYFSFRLAQAGAHVIAADIDPRFQGFIEQRKSQAETGSGTVETRLIPYDSPGLATAEADHVLLVDAYHHIDHRQDYFRRVRAGIKPGGKLVIVDFRKIETPEGPPLSMRIDQQQVQQELTAAGFTKFDLNTTLLPYQYLLSAQ